MEHSDRKEQRPNNLGFPHHGPQGIDKAPGEEQSGDNVQFTQQSQKGKKVDADPAKDSDRPIEQDNDL